MSTTIKISKPVVSLNTVTWDIDESTRILFKGVPKNWVCGLLKVCVGNPRDLILAKYPELKNLGDGTFTLTDDGLHVGEL